MKVLTLGLIRENDKILLGMKKRGFGEGRWNGFGGKVEEGETIEEGMKREMFEECSIKVNESEKKGVITFVYANDGKEMQVHIYQVTKYSQEPIETEEMKPQWFDLDKIPFDQMWPDDKIWMPIFLAGKKFSGTVYFKDTNTITSHDIKKTEILI